MVNIVDIEGVFDISKPVTQQQFAELIGVSQQAVSDLCSRKVLIIGQDVGEWLKRYCSHLREQAAGRATNGDLDLATERAGLAKAQREKIEMQNDVMRKEYAPVSAMEMGLSEVMAVVGSKLDTIPGKLKLAFDKLSSEDIDVTAKVIADVRNDVANLKIDWFGENTNYEEADDSEVETIE